VALLALEGLAHDPARARRSLIELCATHRVVGVDCLLG
jgi:hypothetical protein